MKEEKKIYFFLQSSAQITFAYATLRQHLFILFLSITINNNNNNNNNENNNNKNLTVTLSRRLEKPSDIAHDVTHVVQQAHSMHQLGKVGDSLSHGKAASPLYVALHVPKFRKACEKVGKLTAL